MKLDVWNVRGLNDLPKQREVRNLIRKLGLLRLGKLKML
jgi:hypothetical protein